MAKVYSSNLVFGLFAKATVDATASHFPDAASGKGRVSPFVTRQSRSLHVAREKAKGNTIEL
jgi:hypothetical protein